MKAALRRLPAAVAAARSAYRFVNWVENRRAVFERRAPYLAAMAFDEVRFSNRANEPEEHLRRTRRLVRLDDSDVLVAGVGRGDELDLWKRERPRSLTAIDRIAHPDDWARHAGVRFEVMDVRSLDFPAASFDVVASAAVLEHVDGVEAAAAEMARVTRPGGVVFASFGPLFYTYGGAHYLGAYEHLWLSEDELTRYLERRGIERELEEGSFWLANGMFSRRTYDEYLEIFRGHFGLHHVILFVSPAALRFRRERSLEWEALRRRFDEKDLLTSGAAVWMTPA